MKVEIWKDIENFSKYQVSNLGNVKSKDRYTKAKDVETKLNINHSHISDCCRGKRNKTGGYSWRFVNE